MSSTEAASSSAVAGNAACSLAWTCHEMLGGEGWRELSKLDAVDEPIKVCVCRTIGRQRESLGSRQAARQSSKMALRGAWGGGTGEMRLGSAPLTAQELHLEGQEPAKV